MRGTRGAWGSQARVLPRHKRRPAGPGLAGQGRAPGATGFRMAAWPAVPCRGAGGGTARRRPAPHLEIRKPLPRAALRTALYLAHMNPVTEAHEQIIADLRSEAERVVVMPVRFVRGGEEVNSRSFPFTHATRARMVRALFGDGVAVSGAYTFTAPFSRYLPPLLSRESWRLRRRIAAEGGGDYFTYTGDRAEWLALGAYGLRPVIGRRRAVSATGVRERMYRAALGEDVDWRRGLPGAVADIVAEGENWGRVCRLAGAEDTTRRVMGMKFPA